MSVTKCYHRRVRPKKVDEIVGWQLDNHALPVRSFFSLSMADFLTHVEAFVLLCFELKFWFVLSGGVGLRECVSDDWRAATVVFMYRCYIFCNSRRKVAGLLE